MNIKDKQLIKNFVESQKNLEAARKLLSRAFATREEAQANAVLCTDKDLAKRLQAIESKKCGHNRFRFKMFEDQIKRINENKYDFSKKCVFTQNSMSFQ